MRTTLGRSWIPGIWLALAAGLVACGDSGGGDGGVITCSGDDQCPLGWFCSQGVCVQGGDGGPECSADSDCDPGEVCREGQCRPEQTDGGPDGADGDGGGDEEPGIQDIRVDPQAVDFGNGRIGQEVEQQLLILNDGDADLTVFSLSMESGSSPEFSNHPLDTPNAVIPPGQDLPIVISYLPVDGLADSGALLISSNDPDEALVRVPLSSSYKGTPHIMVVGDPATVDPEVHLMDFGGVPVGSPAQMTAYVKNTGSGNAVLAVQNLRTEPLSSLHFALETTPEPPAYLSPDRGPCLEDYDCPAGHQCVSGACIDGEGRVNATVAVVVQFTPQDIGEVEEQLVITYLEDGQDRSRVITLRGTGIQPALEVDPSPVAFGQWFVGQEASLDVVMRNTGGQTLHITSVGLQDGSGPFGLDTGGSTGWNLPPGEQASLRLDYRPATPGAHQDGLELASDDPDSPLLVDVIGNAVMPPVIESEPPAVALGEVQLGQLASAHFLLSNTGGSDLEVERIRLTGDSSPAFSVLQSTLLPIAPGDSARVDLVYAPDSPVGSDAGLVEVLSNDPQDPVFTVELEGVGTDPELEVEPAAVDCGSGYLGAEQGPFLIAVRNVGFGSLQIEALGMAGGSNPDFEVRSVPPLPASLSSNQSLGVEVYFTPLAFGQRTGALRILTADVDGPLVEVTLEGLGTDCPEGFWDIDPAIPGCEYECDLSNGGVEDCDGLDNDCDAETDENLTTRTCQWENQWGICTGTETCSGTDAGWVGCDAAEPAQEVCDTQDNDCDGAVDAMDDNLYREPCEIQAGACLGAVHRRVLCDGGQWLACQNIDYRVNPEYGDEICDDVDNDCDDLPDQGCDDDQDGWCDADMQVAGSPAICPNGPEDCEDENPLIHPGMDEICATDSDDDCDGQFNDLDASDCTNFYLDRDEDGWGVDAPECRCFPAGSYSATVDGDCNDFDPWVSPGNQEVCGNSVDEDCSGFTDDKDLDGDGYVDGSLDCGGDDCDDTRPWVYPGATEEQDTLDNDCDGLVDEGLIPPGAVIVTEIMIDPDAVTDDKGEWLEVTNVWSHPVNLHSWQMRDGEITFPDEHSIDAPLGVVLEPGEAAVLCRDANPAQNGGVECAYDYTDFLLGNGGDEIILELAGVEIDRVEYAGTSPWPHPSGASVNLDPNAYDRSENDQGGNWCETPANAAYQLPAGDHGTPGLLNPTCSGALAVLDVVPDNGLEFGGDSVVILGAGLTGAETVRIGSVDCTSFSVLDDGHLSCLTPAQPPGDYDVTVVKGVNQKTLSDGFRYTGEASDPAISWCDLQHPQSLNADIGIPTPLIFGQVFSAGVTEPDGPPPGITGQLGYGPSGSDPRNSPGWLWFDATWNFSCANCGNNDEFMLSLTLEAAGEYSYTYRFSEDGAYTFVYCDYKPGLSDGFSPLDLGVLTVD